MKPSCHGGVFVCVLALVLGLSCATRGELIDAEDGEVESENALTIFGETWQLPQNDVSRPEMPSLAVRRWLRLVGSIDRRLDRLLETGGAGSNKDFLVADLLDQKKRVNRYFAQIHTQYRSIPKPLEELISSLMNRIDDNILHIRAPRMVEVRRVAIDRSLQPMRRSDVRFVFIYRWPLENYRVTSLFGMRTHPITGKVHLHDGIDLAQPTGTLVYATGPGRVIYAGDRSVSGNLVVIQHGEGIRSYYAHLHEILTVRGMRVRQGAPIGTVGQTGRSTGPHLHFKISRRGRAIDPKEMIGTPGSWQE